MLKPGWVSISRNSMGKPKVAHFACKCGQLYDLYQDPYKLRLPDCAKCGEVMEYIRTPADNPNLNVTGCYDVPIEMFSVGLIPGEYAAFKKANREIDLTDQGVPIARTYQEKKQILKYFDYEDRR